MTGSLTGCGSVILALLVAVFPQYVSAADNGIYLGASYGEVSSDYDWNVNGLVLDSLISRAPLDDSGFKLIGGARILDPLAVEVNYTDLGTTSALLDIVCITLPCLNQATIDTTALSVSVVGYKSLPFLDFFGRVGVSRWESEHRGIVEWESTGEDPTVGLGVQFRLGSVALRVEYERFWRADDTVDLASIGLTYTFL